MKRLFLLIVWCLLCGTIACKKSSNSSPAAPALPPITDTGANTFGCLVDGELFLPAPIKGSWASDIVCAYDEVSGRLTFMLDAVNGKTHKGIVFNSVGVNLKDTVLYYCSPSEGKELSARYGTYTKREYSTYNNCPGEFRLTLFDYIHGIAAGTFWFDAVDAATNDTVHIRDGRFDVRF